jgi:hypothetical protein
MEWSFMGKAESATFPLQMQSLSAVELTLVSMQMMLHFLRRFGLTFKATDWVAVFRRIVARQTWAARRGAGVH